MFFWRLAATILAGKGMTLSSSLSGSHKPQQSFAAGTARTGLQQPVENLMCSLVRMALLRKSRAEEGAGDCLHQKDWSAVSGCVEGANENGGKVD